MSADDPVSPLQPMNDGRKNIPAGRSRDGITESALFEGGLVTAEESPVGLVLIFEGIQRRSNVQIVVVLDFNAVTGEEDALIASEHDFLNPDGGGLQVGMVRHQRRPEHIRFEYVRVILRPDLRNGRRDGGDVMPVRLEFTLRFRQCRAPLEGLMRFGRTAGCATESAGYCERCSRRTEDCVEKRRVTPFCDATAERHGVAAEDKSRRLVFCH
jgi:hypothetical protein